MGTATKTPERLSVFGDPAVSPTDDEVRAALGPAVAAWMALIEHVTRTYPPASHAWNFAGARYGWSLRLRQAERVVLYLIPQRGRFLVGIVLGASAVAASREADLPADVRRTIAEAPRHSEGTGVRLAVSSEDELAAITALAALKMARR